MNLALLSLRWKTLNGEIRSLVSIQDLKPAGVNALMKFAFENVVYLSVMVYLVMIWSDCDHTVL